MQVGKKAFIQLGLEAFEILSILMLQLMFSKVISWCSIPFCKKGKKKRKMEITKKEDSILQFFNCTTILFAASQTALLSSVCSRRTATQKQQKTKQDCKP